MYSKVVVVRNPSAVELMADGPDERQAVESLSDLIEEGFGEI